MTRTWIVLIAVLGLAPPGVAQERLVATRDGHAPLDAFARQLGKVDAKVLHARLAELEREAAECRKKASALRAEAGRLIAQASEQELGAEAALTEIERQRRLMKLLGTSGAVTAAKPSMKKKPATGMKVAKASGVKMTAAPQRRLLNFEDHILPLFEASCVVCHDPDGPKGDFDCSTYDAVMQGGSSGEVVKRGDGEGSRLYRLVAHLDSPRMPRGQGKWPREQVDRLRQWIDDGAHPDAASAAKAANAPMKPAPAKKTVTVDAPASGPGPLPDAWEPIDLHVTARAPVAKTIATSFTSPLVALPGNRQVIVFHADTMEMLGALPFAGVVEVLRFSRDGRRLMVAGGEPGRSGMASIFDVKTGRALRTFGRERDSVLAAALSPGGSLIAIGGAGKRVRVYSVEDGELAYEVKDHNDFILAMDFSPDGNLLATSDRAGAVVVTDATNGRNVHVLRGHVGAVHAVRFRPDAARLATAGDDGTVRLWEMEDGKQTGRMNAHRGKTLTLAWSHDGRLASGGSDGIGRFWGGDGKSLGNLPSMGDWIYTLSFGRRGLRLFAGTWRGRPRVFDVKTRKELAGFASL